MKLVLKRWFGGSVVLQGSKNVTEMKPSIVWIECDLRRNYSDRVSRQPWQLQPKSENRKNSQIARKAPKERARKGLSLKMVLICPDHSFFSLHSFKIGLWMRLHDLWARRKGEKDTPMNEEQEG